MLISLKMPKPNTSVDRRKTTGVLNSFAIAHNYCKPAEETEAPGRWSDIRELCSASGKLLDSKSCVLCTQPYLHTKIDCIWKENCSKAILKTVWSPSEHTFKKTSSLASSQNYSNWADASFLMPTLFCVCAQSLLKIYTLCYQCPSHSNYAFCLGVGSNSMSVQYPSVVWHDIWGKHSLLLAKAMFKLLCFITESSPNLTWW